MDKQTVAKELMNICIIPNCNMYNIEVKELLDHMLRMDYINVTMNTEENKPKKGRGRPRGSKKNKPNNI
tara:strand:- start:1716 stop:1922 length:207 start_codon:yes stop_codon:yes gene_type:complete